MKVFYTTLVAILLLLLVLWRPWESDPPQRHRSVPDLVRERERGQEADAPFTSSDLPSRPQPEETPPRPPEISAIDLEKVRDAVDNLEFTLRDYGSALGGNPVGTNAEITAALLGDNAKQMKLEMPAGSTLNANGELCDPWGSPWFFHQLSRSKTELRSAGPDRKMYTEDDFVR